MKKFDVKSITKATLKMKKEVLIEAPIEDVWKVVADHQGMTSWMPMIKQVDLVEKGEHGDWGLGCERHCQFGPDLLQEKIVHWDPPYGYAYQIADMHLVKNHTGYISLVSQGSSTRVVWAQYFDGNGNFFKNFISQKIMIPNVMKRALNNLNRKIKAA